MLELKKVSKAVQDDRAHICLPCPICLPWWWYPCWPDNPCKVVPV